MTKIKDFILQRDWLVRALKTFIQAFLGVLVPETIAILNGNMDAIDDWKKVVIPLLASSIAAGISAIWNILKEKFEDDLQQGKNQ